LSTSSPFDFSKDVAANAASLGITDTADPCLKTNFTPNTNCIDPVTHQIAFDKFLCVRHRPRPAVIENGPYVIYPPAHNNFFRAGIS